MNPVLHDISEAFSCDGCFRVFSEGCRPLILPMCGHNLCTACTAPSSEDERLEASKYTCPVCGVVNYSTRLPVDRQLLALSTIIGAETTDEVLEKMMAIVKDVDVATIDEDPIPAEEPTKKELDALRAEAAALREETEEWRELADDLRTDNDMADWDMFRISAALFKKEGEIARAQNIESELVARNARQRALYYIEQQNARLEEADLEERVRQLEAQLMALDVNSAWTAVVPNNADQGPHPPHYFYSL